MTETLAQKEAELKSLQALFTQIEDLDFQTKTLVMHTRMKIYALFGD